MVDNQGPRARGPSLQTQSSLAWICLRTWRSWFKEDPFIHVTIACIVRLEVEDGWRLEESGNGRQAGRQAGRV